MLYIVGTPIGNIADISLRAKEVLSSVDLIACEDTRKTGLLLQKLGIRAKRMSYHEHNRAVREKVLIAKLLKGQKIALVSDAGMPCISDPGQKLVQLCAEQDIPVTVIPGPTAFVSALALSGMDSRRFIFEGFLPVETKERKERIQAVCASPMTVILYEAPHRLIRTIEELEASGAGARKIAICKEITKKYEQVLYTTIAEAAKYFCKNSPKGEYVLVIEGVSENKVQVSETDLDKQIVKLHQKGCSTREIVSSLAQETGLSRNLIYSRAVLMIEYRKEIEC